MYAVIRIRGRVNLKEDIKDTLAMLRLSRKMHCVLIKDSDCMKGMLQKVRNWVTWGEIDDDTLKLLIKKNVYLNEFIKYLFSHTIQKLLFGIEVI